MDDIAASLEYMRRTQSLQHRAAKAPAWTALQRQCPEFVPTFRDFCRVFGGVDALSVEGNGETANYGTPDPHDGWVNPRLGEPCYTERKGEI